MHKSCTQSECKSLRVLEKPPKDNFIIFHFYEDSLADLAVVKSKYNAVRKQTENERYKNYNPNSKDERHEIEVNFILVTSHRKKNESCFWACIGKT